MNIPTEIESTFQPPTHWTSWQSTNLSLTEDLKRKDTPPMVLKLTTLEMVDFHYPEKDLLRVNTDGSGR